MCHAVLRRIPNDHQVPEDPLVCDNRQGETCHEVSVKVPDDRWVPHDLLVPDDPLIHDDRQGRTCRVVSGKVPNDCWGLDDP